MSFSALEWLRRNTGIKSVQRGVTTGAATVAISPVNMSKAFVISVSKGSSGFVAARGSIAQQNINVSGQAFAQFSSEWPGGRDATTALRTFNGTASATSISGGTTDLTVREFSARLTSSTQLTCDGPVEWQVVEYR